MAKTRNEKSIKKPSIDRFGSVLQLLGTDLKTFCQEIADEVKEMYSEACDQVLQDRIELKNMLEPCFEGKMPSTPKKNYKPPAGFVHRKPPHVLEFDDENEPEVPSTSTHKQNIEDNVIDVHKQHISPRIQETEVVIEDKLHHAHIEVHVTEATATVPVFPVTRTSVKTPEPLPRTLKPRTPAHLVDAIPATPSPIVPVLNKPLTRSKVTKSKNALTADELQKKNELAAARKAELQKEKAERHKYDNDQRKRRVEENRRKKMLEEAQKKEEHRKKHEAIKKFQEEQRKTPLPTTPKPCTPKTPRQKAVPAKKAKPGPAAVHRPKAMEIDERTEEMDHQSCEAIHPTLSERIVEEDDQTVDQNKINETQILDKENQVIPSTPQPQRLNQSAYEMTPEKVPIPSTENDYNVADLSSNDETDNEDEPRKKVPGWAQKDQLRVHISALKQRMSKEQIDNHFGQVRPPRVLEIFGGPTKKTYRKLDETTLWDSPIQNPRPAPLQNIRSLN
ncbi:unnamed protein product [Bursaphelenchus xylophilus]|uniref:(pine wood nematode) hypothetical protein n=1 Tax=Bursaphelenchus xylophilus TaxID=6326 RepID=A0A1I7RS63_BURXY|nr:unnamed protein product [Bursaphelenchus xylophilus]CAG9123178.1 unnamed protein product [Bursaphelenchus xylophilus]